MTTLADDVLRRWIQETRHLFVCVEDLAQTIQETAQTLQQAGARLEALAKAMKDVGP